MSKTNQTIRDILEQVDNGQYIDQALKEISELLLECKPEKNTHDVTAVAHFDYPKCCERVEGYNQGLDDYEKNIKARLQ